MDAFSYNRLQPACEETFGHLIEYMGDDGKSCLFRIEKREEGVFSEVICADEVEDVDQGGRPFKAIQGIQAKEGELSKLGLLLLAEMAKEVQHIHISGYTYLSFLVDP